MQTDPVMALIPFFQAQVWPLLFVDPPSSLPFYLVSSYSLVQLSNIAHVNMVLGPDTVLGLEQPYVQVRVLMLRKVSVSVLSTD